jgi:hypothetical protein
MEFEKRNNKSILGMLVAIPCPIECQKLYLDRGRLGNFDKNTMKTSFKKILEIGNVTEIKGEGNNLPEVIIYLPKGRQKGRSQTQIIDKINVSAAVATFAGQGYCS